MRHRRAALRLLRRLPVDGPADDSDRLLIEAWLWRQCGDRGREVGANRQRARLLNRRQRSLLHAMKRFEVSQ